MAPEGPDAATFNDGDRVFVAGRAGYVRFCGTTQFAAGVWVGVELDDAVGKNDGKVKEVAYFNCKPQHGIFVRPAQVSTEPSAKAAPKAATPASPAKAAAAAPEPKAAADAKASPEVAKGAVDAAASPPPASPRGSNIPGSPRTPKAGSGVRSSRLGSQLQPGGSAAPGAKAAAPVAGKPQGSISEPRNGSVINEDQAKQAAAAAEDLAAKTEASARAVKEKQELYESMEKMEEELTSCKRDITKLKEQRERTAQEVTSMEAKRDELVNQLPDHLKPKPEAEKKLTDDNDHALTTVEKERAEWEEEKAKLMDMASELDKRVMSMGNRDSGSQKAKELLCNIELERAQKELLELRCEEAELHLEELREELELSESQATWTQDEIMCLHMDALRAFAQDCRREVRKLQRREAELEYKQRKLEKEKEEKKLSAQHDDMQELRRSYEQLEKMKATLEANAGEVTAAVELRKSIRERNEEMSAAYAELETTLREELKRNERRDQLLSAAVRKLHRNRDDIRDRRQEQTAEAGRCEIRMQALSQQDMVGDAASSEPGSLTAKELGVAIVRADSFAASAKATGWKACIPAAVREKAELGDSFGTLCALHRCLQKAHALSHSIHNAYFSSPTLAMLHTSAPMQWLCHVSLASAQVAYATVGVLGRLHGASAERYTELIRNAGLCACANGERALDTAIGAFLEILAGVSSGRAANMNGLPQALNGLRALSAQLLALNKGCFKEEPFASWQGAAFALEAIRRACASAFFASADAGGTRRRRWQELDKRAGLFARRLTGGDGQSMTFLAIEPGVQDRSRGPAEDGAPEASEGGGEAPADLSRGPTLKRLPTSEGGGEGQLHQELLDGLLRQVAVLSANSAREPPEGEAGDKLDRAFDYLDNHLKELNVALQARGDGAQKAEVVLPWTSSSDVTREQLATVGTDALTRQQELESKIQAMRDAKQEAEARLGQVQDDLRQVEKQFGAARMERERHAVQQATAERLQVQAQASVNKRKELEDDLQKEGDQALQVEKATLDYHRKAEELRAHVEDLERRIAKHFATGVPVEEVLALRRTCARQERNIAAFQRRSFEACGAVAAPPPLSTPPEQASGSSKDGVADISSCWRVLRETQAKLLMEQSSATIVSIEDSSKLDNVFDENEARQKALKKQATDLKGDVYKLLARAAAPPQQNHKERSRDIKPEFKSVALTRFMRATAHDKFAGPAGAKLKIPIGCSAESLPPLNAPVTVPMLADPVEWQSLHHAVL